jgi:hypothetical protein
MSVTYKALFVVVAIIKLQFFKLKFYVQTQQTSSPFSHKTFIAIIYRQVSKTILLKKHCRRSGIAHLQIKMLCYNLPPILQGGPK